MNESEQMQRKDVTSVSFSATHVPLLRQGDSSHGCFTEILLHGVGTLVVAMDK